MILSGHQMAHWPASHGLLALGGYDLPSLSTLGSQVQRSSSGTVSMTMAMCEPHPHQVDLSGKCQPVYSLTRPVWRGDELQVSQDAFLHIVADGKWLKSLRRRG